jgi:hypothetical protein
MDLYIYVPIRLHGVVLNYLSTGITLPLMEVCENKMLGRILGPKREKRDNH